MTKSLATSDSECVKLFSGKKPKGFGKFYEENKEQKSESNDKPKESSSEEKPPPPKSDNESPKAEKKGKPKQTPQPKSKNKDGFEFSYDFDFNKFANGSNKDNIYTIAMIGTALALGIYSYYNYLYQEISWKDLSK